MNVSCVYVIILAAGRGMRFQDKQDLVHATAEYLPKQYAQLNGIPILRHTIDHFLRHPRLKGVVVVFHNDDEILAREACKGLDVLYALGGETRQASTLAGLQVLENVEPEPTHVLIHDAARPCVSKALIDRVLQGLETHEASCPSLFSQETVYIEGKSCPRESVYLAQTPQAFAYKPFKKLHEEKAGGQQFLDDISLVADHMSVIHVPGERENIKITQPSDLNYVRWKLTGEERSAPTSMRIGLGFDMHGFGPGDHVFLCGIKIPHTHGLVGHSDGDVGMHAVADAIFGALNKGDLGVHFPPTDEWRGASSSLFLEKSCFFMQEARAEVVNIDLTIIAQAPALAKHYASMALCLSSVLRIDARVISVKAKTTDRHGCIGRKESIAALASVLLVLK